MPKYADDVKNADLPYVGPISESGLRPGCKIVVKGKVEEGANRFHINLQCGCEEDPRSDVAFHFNPRMGGQVIVRNTFQGGWGDEERDLDNDFPFAEGEKFAVIIHVGKRAFNVIVNGKQLLRYKHRIEDLSLVNTIAVNGGIKLKAIQISEGGYLEYPYDEPQHFICRPEIPFEGGVPFGNLRKGSKIIVQGQVKEGPERFHLNLMAGDDIALHFNPRFGGEVVVRNTKQGGWGKEERDQDEFPFKEGEMFEIAILCRKKKFQIFVNSKQFCTYNHRIEDLNSIDGIQAKGDVEIHSIQLQEKSKLHVMPWRDGSFFLGGEVPFCVPLPEAMSEGTMISVCGLVDEDPNRFHINLQCGEEDDANVAFHFNPRFGKGVIVRNNRVDNHWNKEQREDELEDGFPFEPNCFFNVVFSCENDCYKVAVNGKHLLDFAHRTPCDEVTHLLVAGAIRLLAVRIE